MPIYGVDVDERVGGLLAGEVGAELRGDERGGVVEVSVGGVGEGVEDLGAGRAGRKGGDLGRDLRCLDAARGGVVVNGGGVMDGRCCGGLGSQRKRS